MQSQASPFMAAKRLSKELETYQEEGENEIFLYLRPVDEADLLLWEAVLKGPVGTPYEGKFTKSRSRSPVGSFHAVNLMWQQVDFGTLLLKSRRPTLMRRRPSNSRLKSCTRISNSTQARSVCRSWMTIGVRLGVSRP